MGVVWMVRGAADVHTGMVRIRFVWLFGVIAVLWLGARPATAAPVELPDDVNTPSAHRDAIVSSWLGPPYARAAQRRITLTTEHGHTKPLSQFDGLLAFQRHLKYGDSFNEEADFRVDSSATWAAVGATRTLSSDDGASHTDTVETFRLAAAPLRGRARVVARCRGRRVEFALTASVLAYTDCADTALLVQDLERPTAGVQRIALPAGYTSGPLQVAGQFVGVRLYAMGAFTPGIAPTENPLAVFDTASAAEVSATSGLAVDEWALRPDGTIVMAAMPFGARPPNSRVCDGPVLDVYTLAPGSGPRPLALKACPEGPISVSGSRVLFEQPGANGVAQWAVTDANGTAPLPLVDGRQTLTFDDTAPGTVIVGGYSCRGGPTYAFLALSRLVTGPRPRLAACTLRFAPTARSGPDRTVRIGYRCPAGCEGSLALTIAGHRVVQPRYTNCGEIEAAPGHRATTCLILSRRLAARLRRRGRLDARATAVIDEPQAVPRGHLRKRRFSARILLRSALGPVRRVDPEG